MNINGRVKVKTLKAQFFEEFGLTIRVYDGRSFADDNATLASIRRGESIGGEFSPRKNTKVGNLEDKIKELFGLKTQIAGSDNSYLCDNNITLAKAKEDDEARMARKAKKSVKVNEKMSYCEQSNFTDASIILKKLKFFGELSYKSFNQLLLWDETDALESIDSYESTTDSYAMVFNSPVFGNCDNLESFFDNEEDFWGNLQDYIDNYGIEEHELWRLVTKSYCSMLVKTYLYKDKGDFEISDIDITDKTNMVIKLLSDELDHKDNPEQIGLTISDALLLSFSPTDIEVEVFNFDNGPEIINLSDFSHLFPNRAATKCEDLNRYDINDVCILFAQSTNGAANLEDICYSINESEYAQDLYSSGIEIEIEDIVNFLKTKKANFDFSNLLRAKENEKENDFYKWLENLYSNKPEQTQHFAKILNIKELIIEINGKVYYYNTDNTVIENAEEKQITEIVSLICNDKETLKKIEHKYKLTIIESTTLDDSSLGEDCIDNGDGTVTDKRNGLTWQLISVGQDWENGICLGEAVKFSWDEAINSHSDFAGYHDWRLPTISELESLIDSIEQSHSIPNSKYFIETPSGIFWSSTSASTVGDGGPYARSIDFSKGESRKNTKTYTNYVKLVRG